MELKKLGIIVPYRDRYDHLLKFKMAIQAKLYEAKIPYELIVVEQDNADSFNRGKLLNIGFIEAEKLGCDYVVFHDVDMIPKKVDYSYADHPIHLATEDIPFQEYFGGITLFPIEDFKKINGFSNEYWGWGFEDDDLLHRCKVKGILLDAIPSGNGGPNTAALKFNGNSSYIRIANPLNTRRNFSIHLSLEVQDFQLDHSKREDKYVVFGIPGFDMNIMYTSFRRFAVEWFSGKKKHRHIFSNIIPPLKTTLTVTYNKKLKKVTFYQNSNYIGAVDMDEDLYLYNKEDYAYIGCTTPNREEDKNYFRGTINSVATWEEELTRAEVIELANNNYFGLATNFGDYKSDHHLTSYYDAKFIRNYKLIDITGKSEDAEIVDCEMVKYDAPQRNRLHIPFRRDSTYRVLSHEDNGFLNTGWKDSTTRYNQLKFMNEVMRGYRKPEDDGLTTCKYKVLSKSNVRQLTQITVKL